MKKLFALLAVLLILGCATVPIAGGAVLEKFARGGYAEYSLLRVDDNWMPVPLAHLPTYWVSVQGNGCRIEIPLMKERWDAVHVGDLIFLGDSDEGGGT